MLWSQSKGENVLQSGCGYGFFKEALTMCQIAKHLFGMWIQRVAHFY